MLAVTIGGTAATIGLYRPEVCLDRRRFLLSGTISALLAFPAILLVSGAYRMTLSEDHIVWLARLLAIWLPFVLLVRFALSALAARMPVARRVLIVGGGSRAALLRRRLATKRHGLFEPIMFAAIPAPPTWAPPRWAPPTWAPPGWPTPTLPTPICPPPKPAPPSWPPPTPERVTPASRQAPPATSARAERSPIRTFMEPRRTWPARCRRGSCATNASGAS